MCCSATLEVYHVCFRNVAYPSSAEINVGHDDLEWYEYGPSLKMALQTHQGTASSRVLHGYSTPATDSKLPAAQDAT